MPVEQESACQRKGVSCGACCGIFNLRLADFSERRALLAERTREFGSVRFDDSATYVAYRAAREEREGRIARHDAETYVCPFYGYLDGAVDGSGQRTGCLIHPARTGFERSQNYSFYGAAICQAYDCPNKESDGPHQAYARLLAARFSHADDYARLMADTAFRRACEREVARPAAFWERLAARAERATEHGGALAAFDWLARARLRTAASARVTSFELRLREYPDAAAEWGALFADEADLVVDGRSVSTGNLVAAWRALGEP